MRYRIFTPIAHADFEYVWLARNASLFFRSKIQLVEREPERLVVQFQGDFAKEPIELSLLGRSVKKQDRKDVIEAERLGQAAGMGSLASQCRLLWELAAPEDAPPAALLAFAAATASVALGPILPPDGLTLFGVRDAFAKAEQMRSSQAD